jgi:hypothetical protein
MDPLEMVALLKREPFQPFRVYLTDGRVFDIHHPELSRVTRHEFLLGIPLANAPDPRVDHHVLLGWSSIQRVEMLPAAAPAR